MDYLKIQQLSRDEVLNEAKDLYPRWVHLSADEKQKIVETIVDRIVVAEDEVTIELCYVTSSAEIVAQGQRDLTDSLLSVA